MVTKEEMDKVDLEIEQLYSKGETILQTMRHQLQRQKDHEREY